MSKITFYVALTVLSMVCTATTIWLLQLGFGELPLTVVLAIGMGWGSAPGVHAWSHR